MDAKDQLNRTPSGEAAFGGNKDVAALLLAGQADVNAADKNGWERLHSAASWHNGLP